MYVHERHRYVDQITHDQVVYIVMQFGFFSLRLALQMRRVANTVAAREIWDITSNRAALVLGCTKPVPHRYSELSYVAPFYPITNETDS